MAFSLYQASVKTCLQLLGGLSAVLTKAAAHAEARKIDPSVFLTSRLAPDMFTMVRQVQIATDGAKAGCARLAGAEYPSYPDTETSFDELQARIARTVTFLEGLDRTAIEGAVERTITFKVGPMEMKMLGADYATGWILPNFFFHVTTAYDILRHNGVALSKRDYLGTMPLAA